MASTVNLRALGLYTAPNQLSLPEGSLSVASNVVIRQEGLVQSRRGYKLYGDTFGSTLDVAKQVFTYKDRLIRHYNETLQFDNGLGDFTSFAGSYTEQETGLRIKKIESNGNAYFTTSKGIYKISANNINDLSSAAGYITPAGGIKAIDFQAMLNVTQGDNSSWFPADSVVSYEILWGQTDATSNLILGTPSSSVDVSFSLSDAIVIDTLATTNALDMLTTGLITDDNYTSTALNDLNPSGPPLETLSSSIKSTLQSLAEKLDTDIKLAGASSPLTISGTTVALDNVTVTITFSAGDPTQYISVNDSVILSGFVTPTGDINAVQLITEVTSTTIVFVNDTALTGPASINGDIYSYNYRVITAPGIIDDPATHDQLLDLQTYLNAIIERLKAELAGVIPTPDKNAYIDVLELTTTATVDLLIDIPADVTTNHFYQVYRSTPVEALQTAILQDLVPTSEFQLVYEAFPTSAQLAAGLISLEDTTPEAFKGTFLYTNASTGEGILQANDIPPFAKDINRFKGYTFYANTRTRYRDFISLLGVQKMIVDYGLGNTPTLTVTDSEMTSIYSFVTGLPEITRIEMKAFAAITGGDYFTLNTAYDQKQYYVWYDKTGTDTDPAVSGRTGIRVLISGLVTTTEVRDRTRDILAAYIYDFSIDTLSTPDRIEVTNIDSGKTTDATSSSFTIVISQQGRGENVTYHKDQITVNSVPVSNQYFYIFGHQNTNRYYVWYRVDASGTDPAAGGTAILVDILSTDTTTQVAQKTAAAIDSLSEFVSSNIANVLTIENYPAGLTNTATIGTMGGAITISNLVAGALDVLLSDVASPAQSTDDTARSLVRVINENRGSNIYAYYLSGVQDVPGKMLFEAKSLNNVQFTVTTNNSNTGSSFNPDLSPTNTITAIGTGSTPTITSAAHGLVDGDQIVISHTNSTPVIDGIFTVSNTTTNTFVITSSVFTAGTTGSFIKFASSATSSNEVKGNRVYYSKFQQPEAVPILNFLDVGGSDDSILRIFPLRDSLFVFKQDGLYRISGEIAPFTVSLFDSSCKLSAPDSVDVSNNLVYCWTRQGITVVSEGGTQSISRPIEFDVNRINTQQFTNFYTATWGLGYESDNSYLVFTVADPSDDRGVIGYRYSTLTNTWTTFDMSATCGVISRSQDRMYLGAGDINSLEVERKNFDRTDYADREHTLFIAANKVIGNGITVAFSQLQGAAVGDVVEQSKYLTIYIFNSLLQKLDIDPGVSDTNYYSTLRAIAGDDIKVKLLALATKLDADPGVALTDFFSTISPKSGSITGITATNPAVITSAAHGLINGRIIAISGSTSIPDINSDWTVSGVTANTFTIPIGVSTPVADGSFVTLDNDINDIKVCYNAVITKLNADSGVAYSNYAQANDLINIEAIVVNVDNIIKKITFNVALDFTVGEATLYKSINSYIIYSPITMGNPLSLKHLYETTLMFQDKTFTQSTLSFATDLLPQFIDVPVPGMGNGIFGIGSGKFGLGFFGGNSHSAPFRTYVPRNCQRCTFLRLKHSHSIAREIYTLYGATVTAADQTDSTRGYR